MPWDGFGRFCHDFRLVPNILAHGDCTALWAHNAIIQRHLLRQHQSKYTNTTTNNTPTLADLLPQQAVSGVRCLLGAY